MSIRVNGKIHRMIIRSAMLYGAEIWTVGLYRSNVNMLHAFMMRHLRSIMKIIWQDKLTNINVLKQAGLPYMEDLTRKHTLWTGHNLTMRSDRMSSQVLYSHLRRGRQYDNPHLRYKDIINRTRQKRENDTNSATYLEQH